MSSNEDPAATRDQEVKETEEVEVGERPAEGGENEAVGGGGDGPAAGRRWTAPSGRRPEVRRALARRSEMAPVKSSLAQGALSVLKCRRFLGVCSKTVKELLQSLLLTDGGCGGFRGGGGRGG